MTGLAQTACDENGARTSAHSSGVDHPKLTLVATILASSLAFIDGSVVNVALPAIGRDLGGRAADLQWTVNAYLLPLSALLLIGGAAGDRFGRRRLLLLGIALFALSSLACALAPGLDVLLPARVAQGLGAAMLMPNSLATLGNAFSGEARGRAIGTWAAAGAIFAAAGPPIGGWLVDTLGWRAIFYLNLPVALAAIVVIRFAVAETTADGGHPIDWPGAALATLGLLGVTFGLTSWSAARTVDAATLAAVSAGVVLLGAFVAVQIGRGERAMMPVALFASRAFGGLTLSTFLLYGALGGLLVLLPYLLIVAGGYTPLGAGVALLPFPLTIGVASRAMGRLAERIGARLPLTIGPLVAAIGYALFARVEPGDDYWTGLFPAMLVLSLGMAGAVAPLTSAVLSSVNARHTGTASGFNSAIARTGGLIATALVGGVLAARGEALVSAFQAAALWGGAMAAAAGIVAFVTLGGSERQPPGVERSH